MIQRAPTVHLQALGASLLLFALMLAIFATSPVTTPTDSRWSVHTAMSFANGHWGDLTQYLPIIEKHEFKSIEFPDGRPRTRYPMGPSLLAMPIVAVMAWLRPEWAAGLQSYMPVRT